MRFDEEIILISYHELLLENVVYLSKPLMNFLLILPLKYAHM